MHLWRPRDELSSVMIKEDLVSSMSFRFSFLFGTDPHLHSLLTSKTHASIPTWQPGSIKLALQKSILVDWSVYQALLTSYTNQLILVSNKNTDWKPCRLVFWRTDISSWLVLPLHNPGYFLAPWKHGIKEHARIHRLPPLPQWQEPNISSLSITSITLFVLL